MAGSIYTVRPGSAQQFTGAPVPKGAIVRNLASKDTDTIWVSSDRNVTPNNGLKLRPQASVNWAGKQLFACMDTGSVADGIDMQISDDADTISDPLSVAEAIIINGVPNVFLGDILVDQKVLVPGAGFDSYDVSQYASLQLYVSLENNTDLVDVWMQTFFAPNADAIVVTPQQLSLGSRHGTTGNLLVTLMWEIPVRGNEFFISNGFTSEGNLVYTLIGTNRLVSGVRQCSDSLNPRLLQLGPQDVVNGQTYFLTAADAGADLTTLSGPCTYAVNKSANIMGTLACEWIGTGGGIGGANFQSDTSGVANHPVNPLRWIWTAGADAVGLTVQLALIPYGLI